MQLHVRQNLDVKIINMKNLLIYYFQIILPLPLIYYSLVVDDSNLFFTSCIFYYVYRIITDYHKLLNKNLIKKNDFLIFIFPIWNIKFFKELYFEV